MIRVEGKGKVKVRDMLRTMEVWGRTMEVWIRGSATMGRINCEEQK